MDKIYFLVCIKLIFEEVSEFVQKALKPSYAVVSNL